MNETAEQENKDKEDLKPRGEKSQMWLGVSPSTIKHFVAHRISTTGGLGSALDVLQRAVVDDRSVQLEVCDVLALVGAVRGRQALVLEAMTVFEFGAKKYAPGNFRRAFDDISSMRREYVSAMLRHWLADLAGEEMDPESGLPHRSHFVCGALMLLEAELCQD